MRISADNETKNRLLPWSIGGVSRALEGTLKMAHMPPVAGQQQPVQRVVAQLDRINHGDVFLLLGCDWKVVICDAIDDRSPPDPVEVFVGRLDRVRSVQDQRIYQWWAAHEAFRRGALAVVTSLNEIHPWEGRCVIVVGDVSDAQRRWHQILQQNMTEQSSPRETMSENRGLHRSDRNGGISTLPSLLG